MKTHVPDTTIVVIPLGLARSALFSAGRPPGASNLKGRPVAIATQRRAELAQNGPALGQGHALAWQAVLHWAADAGITDDRAFTVAADDLWRVLGRKGGDSDQRARMARWLSDLAAARIRYRTAVHDYTGPLLLDARRNDGTGRQVLRLPPEFPALMSDEILRNDLRRKSRLGADALALWLHDYIATHLRPPPDSVDSLRMWSGSGQDLPHFRHALRRALRRLAPKVPSPEAMAGFRPAAGALVLDWHIDRHDRLHIQKAPTSVAVPKKCLASQRVSRQEEAAAQARALRANGTQ